jgi:hypothetical protein
MPSGCEERGETEMVVMVVEPFKTRSRYPNLVALVFIGCSISILLCNWQLAAQLWSLWSRQIARQSPGCCFFSIASKRLLRGLEGVSDGR